MCLHAVSSFSHIPRFDHNLVLRALEDLAANERVMHELDNRKDQIMTICKVALANLAMWVRDRFFPATYAHATWQRLQPFFRLEGSCVVGSRGGSGGVVAIQQPPIEP